MELINNSIYAKPGAVDAFREHLTITRGNGYGDWLYKRDRPLFDELLHRALIGSAEQEFDGPKWFVGTKLGRN